MDPKMMKLEENIGKYGELDVTVKDLTKQKDPLNKEIKEQMSELGLSEMQSGAYTASYTVQHRTSMDEAKLLAFLEANKLEQAIMTVRRANPSIVEDLVHQGVISAQDISHCVIVKPVEVLSVSVAKAAKPKSPKASITSAALESKGQGVAAPARPLTVPKFNTTPLGDTF